jgi:hypothetical protein
MPNGWRLTGRQYTFDHNRESNAPFRVQPLVMRRWLNSLALEKLSSSAQIHHRLEILSACSRA